SVLDEDHPRLTPYQRANYEAGKSEEVKVDVENNMYHDMIYPHEMRDPIWKWRRAE
ncbi:MAG: hypothetical protein HYZ00_01305, partial [Candidatus Hydrogenedentes bacterium]|nr:hypothetical protein [Candidatus Hydrogenedentota bacterium]